MLPTKPAVQPAILRVADMMSYLNVGRTSLYAMVADDPTFPQQIKLGKRAVGWRRHEVDAWIASRPVGDRAAAARQATALREAGAAAGQ